MATTSPITSEQIDNMKAGPAFDKIVEALTDRWLGWPDDSPDTGAAPYSTDPEALDMLRASLQTTNPWLTIHGPFQLLKSGAVSALGGWQADKPERKIPFPVDEIITGDGETFEHAACKVIVHAMLIALGEGASGKAS